MRNIVSWSNPQDRSFAATLTRRIKLVIRPLIEKHESDTLEKSEADKFQSLSLVTRLNLISGIFEKTVNSCGYQHLGLREDIDPWVGRIPKRNALQLCMVSAKATFTKREIRDIVNEMFALTKSRFESFDDDEGYNRQRWQNRWSGLKVPKAIETKYVRTITARLILCSLEKIPNGRLASALPWSAASGQVYAWNQKIRVTYGKEFPITILVHVEAPILSESDANAKSLELSHNIKNQNQWAQNR
jgi:hypothetical protein